MQSSEDEDGDGEVEGEGEVVPMPGRDAEGRLLDPPKMDSVVVSMSIAQLIFSLLGLAIAWGLSGIDEATFNRRVDLWKGYDVHYLLLLAIALRWTSNALAILSQEARFRAGIPPPDQYVHKVVAWPSMPYVLMEEEGDVGRLNRAQRAACNFAETLPFTIIQLATAGAFMPRASLYIVAAICTLRLAYAASYVATLNGRLPALVLGNVAQAALEGILWLAVSSLLGAGADHGTNTEGLGQESGSRASAEAGGGAQREGL